MRTYAPEGFSARDPTATRIRRSPRKAKGPHDEWSGDGHDKLVKYGFAIWGLRDKWTGYWLGLWVVPNNRLAAVIAYLYLTAILMYGGEFSLIEQYIQYSVHCRHA